MGKQSVKSKASDKIQKGNGSSLVPGLGYVHCAGCETVVGYFPPDTYLDDESDLELYCFGCAQSLSKGEH